MPFSPSTYLTSQGWSGPGQALKPGGRAKPITVIKRKGLQGVGKERDTSFAWWDDVFTAVLSKIDKGKGAATGDIHHRTTTGILSPLPAPATGPPNAPDDAITTSPSALNLDAVAYAQQNSARRQLYGRFLRGCTIDGTVSPSSGEEDSASNAEVEGCAEADAAMHEAEGREVGVEAETDAVKRRREKAERKLVRAQKRAAKARSKQLSAVALPPAEIIPPSSVSPRPAQETVAADEVAVLDSGSVRRTKSKKRRREEGAEKSASNEEGGLGSSQGKRSKKPEKKKAGKNGVSAEGSGARDLSAQAALGHPLESGDSRREGAEADRARGNAPKRKGREEAQNSDSLPTIGTTVSLTADRKYVKEQEETKAKKKRRKERRYGPDET